MNWATTQNGDAGMKPNPKKKVSFSLKNCFCPFLFFLLWAGPRPSAQDGFAIVIIIMFVTQTNIKTTCLYPFTPVAVWESHWSQCGFHPFCELKYSFMMLITIQPKFYFLAGFAILCRNISTNSFNCQPTKRSSKSRDNVKKALFSAGWLCQVDVCRDKLTARP